MLQNYSILSQDEKYYSYINTKIHWQTFSYSRYTRHEMQVLQKTRQWVCKVIQKTWKYSVAMDDIQF